MARAAAAIGIATGIVALTGVAALAVGNDDPGTESSFPPGHSRSEWARGDHDGPPPWANGHRAHKDKRHGPPPWAHHDDKRDKRNKPAKPERRAG